jgi:hypothetical protein
LSFVRISNGRWKRRWSSSCHCSARLPGQTNETALEVAPGDELLDEETCHDGLPCPGIVGEEEPEGLPGQHGLVDGGDLVRKGLDERGVHRENGVEEVREADPMRLRDEAKERPVPVEAPGAALLDDFETGFVAPVEDLLGDPPGGAAVDEGEGVGAVPLDVDDGDGGVGEDAADGGGGQEQFELRHAWEPERRPAARRAARVFMAGWWIDFTFKRAMGRIFERVTRAVAGWQPETAVRVSLCRCRDKDGHTYVFGRTKIADALLLGDCRQSVSPANRRASR